MLISLVRLLFALILSLRFFLHSFVMEILEKQQENLCIYKRVLISLGSDMRVLPVATHL